MIKFHSLVNESFYRKTLANDTTPLVINYDCIDKDHFKYRPAGKLSKLSTSETKWFENLYESLNNIIGVTDAEAQWDGTGDGPYIKSSYDSPDSPPPTTSTGGAPRDFGSPRTAAAIAALALRGCISLENENDSSYENEHALDCFNSYYQVERQNGFSCFQYYYGTVLGNGTFSFCAEFPLQFTITFGF